MATYNVFGFGFGIEQAAAALLSGPIGSSPDVTLVQECGSRAQLRRFATSLGARAVSTHRRFSRIRNAVLYRAPWELSGPHTVHDLPSQGPTYPRGLIVAPLRAGAQGLSAVSVHFGLSLVERQAHAAEVVQFLAGLDGPVVVGMDLNEEIDGPSGERLMERLREAFATSGYASAATYPADAPRSRIDYVLASSEIRIIRAWTGEGFVAARGSDHLPVFAEIEIDDAL